MGSSTLPPDAGAKDHASNAASGKPHAPMFQTNDGYPAEKGSAPAKPSGGFPDKQGAQRGGSK